MYVFTVTCIEVFSGIASYLKICIDVFSGFAICKYSIDVFSGIASYLQICIVVLCYYCFVPRNSKSFLHKIDTLVDRTFNVKTCKLFI